VNTSHWNCCAYCFIIFSSQSKGSFTWKTSLYCIVVNYCFLKGLVIAGLADYARPADKLSLTQSIALTSTGALLNLYAICYTNICTCKYIYIYISIGVLQCISGILFYVHKLFTPDSYEYFIVCLSYIELILTGRWTNETQRSDVTHFVTKL